MNSKWVRHLKTTKAKNEFKGELKATRAVFDVLKNILSKEIEDDVKEMRKSNNYTLPNWSGAMADHLATQRTLERVIKLLEI